MKRKIIAFYDVLFYAIICSPLIVADVILFFMLATKGTHEWIFENWYYVVIFAVSLMLSIGGAMLFRYCLVENNTIHFHYFPFTTSWKKASNNIDIKWNQNIFISEIKDVEIVKLTDEEKQSKIFYKHWFNKYLKINLKNDNSSKYIYVGNYSKFQIKKIIKILTIKNLNNKT
ncbi:MAG: hypothetical protein J1F31_06820 [Erysipelotrichales bacterium]|nr:hypothetical protein [Erysipelotrichales bacterium]